MNKILNLNFSSKISTCKSLWLHPSPVQQNMRDFTIAQETDFFGIHASCISVHKEHNLGDTNLYFHRHWKVEYVHFWFLTLTTVVLPKSPIELETYPKIKQDGKSFTWNHSSLCWKASWAGYAQLCWWRRALNVWGGCWRQPPGPSVWVKWQLFPGTGLCRPRWEPPPWSIALSRLGGHWRFPAHMQNNLKHSRKERLAITIGQG